MFPSLEGERILPVLTGDTRVRLPFPTCHSLVGHPVRRRSHNPGNHRWNDDRLPYPAAGAGALGITAGPDGNMWFTELLGNKIGRITPGGTVTEFNLPTSGAAPASITGGPDGNLWVRVRA